MKHNIIFLDFDGVICTHRGCVAIGEKGINTYLDPIALGLLKRLVEEYDAKIVISSTWRQGRDVGYFHDIFRLSGFHELSSALLFDRDDQELWRTPILHGEIRGTEIQQWNDKYDLAKHYVILDDDSDMLEEQKENFVHCQHPYDGLLFEDYMKCRHVFNGDKLSEFKF